jgi:hypothetical protein
LLTHRRLLELLPVRARLPAFPERCGPQDRRAFEHCEESSQCCGGRDRLTDYRSRRSPGRPSSSDTPAVPGLSPPRLPRWISPLPSRSSGRHSQQELLQAGMLRPISPLRRPRRLRLRLRGLVQVPSPSGKSVLRGRRPSGTRARNELRAPVASLLPPARALRNPRSRLDRASRTRSRREMERGEAQRARVRVRTKGREHRTR